MTRLTLFQVLSRFHTIMNITRNSTFVKGSTVNIGVHCDLVCVSLPSIKLSRPTVIYLLTFTMQADENTGD